MASKMEIMERKTETELPFLSLFCCNWTFFCFPLYGFFLGIGQQSIH